MHTYIHTYIYSTKVKKLFKQVRGQKQVREWKQVKDGAKGSLHAE